MLKYTLGALAALAIVVSSGIAILLYARDGDADTGLAPRTIITIDETGALTPERLVLKEDQLISLELVNNSEEARSLRMSSEDVDQLPETPPHDGVGGSPARAGIEIVGQPGSVSTAYVRFKKKGEYQLNIGFADVIFPPTPMRVTVE